MTNDQTVLTIFITLTIAFILVGVFSVIGIIANIYNNYISTRERAKFREDLTSAVKLTQPTWEQVLLISGTQSLSQTDVNIVLREMIRDALSGKAEGMQEHIALLESYLQSHKREEPFEDLPDDVRSHLERIKAHIPDRPELLDPLADQLRELKAKNIREKRRQSYINIVSLIIGIAGLIVGVYAIL